MDRTIVSEPKPLDHIAKHISERLHEIYGGNYDVPELDIALTNTRVIPDSGVLVPPAKGGRGGS